MELAAYELLGRVAGQAGDEETAAAASEIGAQEQRMAHRLEGLFERAVEASLRGRDSASGERLVKYLTDAHAIEAQAAHLLTRGQSIADAPELAAAFEQHLGETREHLRLLEARLTALDASPSRLKDAALSLGALNWGAFFGAQPDTPAKLAGFSYAFEHLEIAAYELLTRVARRFGDEQTAQTAETILSQQRAAAEKVFSTFDGALEASLRELGVGAA